jgi:hypothetical protein
MPEVDNDDWQGQEQAEAFDEDNASLDGAGDSSADMKTLEEMPDVYDVTSAAGDADDDAALIAEDLDDDEIIQLQADADATDIEDDELARRMPEAFDDDSRGIGEMEEVLHAEEGLLDAKDRRLTKGSQDEVELQYAGDLADVARAERTATALEAEEVSDEDLARLDYGGDEGRGFAAAYDGQAGDPVRFEIVLRDQMWLLTRDGRELHSFGRAERAVHEAVSIARELRRSGEPAAVYLEPKEGVWIEITDDDPETAARAEEERSAVVPDRSTNA